MNKKAIEAAIRALDDTYDVSERGELLNHDDVAHVAVSAYLAEVWRPFDVDKPETWPEDGYYLVRRKSGLQLTQWWPDGGFGAAKWRNVTEYCDPQDLMLATSV